MTQEAQLKACPFCGVGFKIAQEPHDNHPVNGLWYLFHDYGELRSPARKCLIDVPKYFVTKAEAIAAWDTRIESGVVAEALLAVVNATRAYLPPDGISEQECINRILEATDNPKINPVIAAWEASK